MKNFSLKKFFILGSLLFVPVYGVRANKISQNLLVAVTLPQETASWILTSLENSYKNNIPHQKTFQTINSILKHGTRIAITYALCRYALPLMSSSNSTYRFLGWYSLMNVFIETKNSIHNVCKLNALPSALLSAGFTGYMLWNLNILPKEEIRLAFKVLSYIPWILTHLNATKLV